MRRRQILCVLVLASWLANAVSAQDQKAGESKQIHPNQRESSSGGRGVARGRFKPRLVEKRPVWADPPAEEAGTETAPVKIAADVSRQRPCHGVQAGAFGSRENASKLVKKLSSEFGADRVLVKTLNGAVPLFRVIVGCEYDSGKAESLRKKLGGSGIQGFVVKVEPDGSQGKTIQDR